MKLKELLPQQVVTVDAGTSLHEVARKMRNRRVGIVPVLQNNHLVGVITDRDITVRAIAATPDGGRLRASDVMTGSPITIQEDADVEDAAVLMRAHRLHRLIVLRENGTVCGVVSLTDLSLLGPEAFEVLRRLSERPMIEQFPEEDMKVPSSLL